MPIARFGAKKRLTNSIQVVPNVAADVTTKDTYLQQMSIANVGAAAATLTVKDKQSTPRYVFNALTVEPNTIVIIAWPQAIELRGGLNWVASDATSIQVALEG